MVSWLAPSARIGPAGGVRGFSRFAFDPDEVPVAAEWGYPFLLSSPGTVDVNGQTRGQYRKDSLVVLPQLTAFADFRFTAGDVAAHPGKYLTATMFISVASAFAPGVVPTPQQIIDSNIHVVRASGRSGSGNNTTVAGDIKLIWSYTPLLGFPPNTKYWLLVVPVATADLAVLPTSTTEVPVGDVNVNGRAISIWSNRTPSAPVITSPSPVTNVFAGQEIDFAFQSKDPDRVASFAGDSQPYTFNDVAGVQIQYARVATEAEPNPIWSDLPIRNADNTLGGGWHIDQASACATYTGAMSLWHASRIKIRCSSVATPAPYTANIPSGSWQIRLRTFDFGHARPGAAGGDVPPLTDTTFSYTPSNYPEVNTSPWSTPVAIKVAEQVPPPIPVEPINGAAVIDTNPVVLRWQYRNTYVPPFDQFERSVQIREVGDPEWTMLVKEEVSSSSSFTVVGFPLVSGNQYEWRVLVGDTSGGKSDWSESGSFWMVPQPATGGVIPAPGELIDGATIGCGTHRVFIYRRGGLERVGEIKNISSLEWNRVRDDISTAKIVVSGWDIDCGNLLAELQTWAYEVVIFRDNGYSVDRVWEGPLTLLTYKHDEVVIHAKDVMAYSYRRIIRQAMSDSTNGATVTDRASRVLLNAYAPDDPNVLAYMQVLSQPDDAKQYRSLAAFSRTAFEEVDDMAANAGLDYTAIGRAILIWGTKHRIGTLPEFQDRDLGNAVIVSEYGMSMSNRYAISDGNGIYGEASRLNEEEKDPIYGLVEMLSSTWASESAADAGTYTQAGIATVKQSFADAAERSIGDRYPPPVVVRVPDNTRLNPDTVLSIRQLVPGVVVPLRSTATLRTVVATQKLDAVKVTEENGEETITVTLSPFSRDDVAVGGEEE